MTDPEIIDKIYKGDHDVFQWLYQEYYIGLCTYAYRFTKNTLTAEEIVQKSIFRLWERRESLQINESIVAYLFRSVKNNCLNHLKHQQIVNRFKESIRTAEQENEELITISQETGLSIYIAHELESKITESIEKLPQQCREIFEMSRFHGLKHREIAKIKGITLNTVQKQISIAINKLKAELTDYLPIAILLIIKILSKN
jgi:RNA polymerase sigma-70 factor (ECF subfamily)